MPPLFGELLSGREGEQLGVIETGCGGAGAGGGLEVSDQQLIVVAVVGVDGADGCEVSGCTTAVGDHPPAAPTLLLTMGVTTLAPLGE